MKRLVDRQFTTVAQGSAVGELMRLNGKGVEAALLPIGGAGGELVFAGFEEVGDPGVQIACAVVILAVQ
ncbi:hypothetical protein [Halomonas chromatireducens]|uniref:hypothetical protein n=1 Tax=Halomonas chromatireducens TaxID=507626 RepID=UPI00082BF48E|nr:hypothetical protein [Halomonas chromatireducens]